jgi:hypothetical protein
LSVAVQHSHNEDHEEKFPAHILDILNRFLVSPQNNLPRLYPLRIIRPTTVVYFRARDLDIMDFQQLEGRLIVSESTTNDYVPEEFRGFSHTFRDVRGYEVVKMETEHALSVPTTTLDLSASVALFQPNAAVRLVVESTNLY